MSRFLYRNLELLEPYEGKLSCTVLRGESSRKGADLPDQKIHKGKYEICFSYFPLKKHASKSPHHLISMYIPEDASTAIVRSAQHFDGFGITGRIIAFFIDGEG